MDIGARVLRVDLAERSWREEIVPTAVPDALLGGRGVAAHYYHREIGPEVDALSPANSLIFMTGPLTGTALPGTGKFQLATRSPETRMYLCSNCGGRVGPELRRAGWDGLIVQGRAAEWTWLSIRDGEVRFEDARGLRGRPSAETLVELRRLMGEPEAGVMSIGPAGESLVRISTINVDERAFGRGGPGAVMGSKRLKGIAVRGTGMVAVADPRRVAEIRASAVTELESAQSERTEYGTPAYMEPMNELGCLPTRNFQAGSFEGIDSVDAFAMRVSARVRSTACAGCPVGCGKMCEVKEGPFAGARARPEFETVALLGPNCGISDFAAIVRATELANDLGIDTMSGGHAVALTMELTERGMLSREDTAGIDARFGSADALIGIIGLIAERRGVGALLAEGMSHVKRVHPDWKPYILDVKGMPFAGYDPRGFHGSGLTYGTSSRGACHNAGGWTIGAELSDSAHDRYAQRGKGGLVKRAQDTRAYVDSLGLCAVVAKALGFTETPSGDVLEAVTGRAFTPRLMEIGERIYALERLILNREGIRRADDMLPERITRESLPGGGAKGRVLTEEMYAVMLGEYYGLRGWDEDGVVTPGTLTRLGL